MTLNAQPGAELVQERAMRLKRCGFRGRAATLWGTAEVRSGCNRGWTPSALCGRRRRVPLNESSLRRVEPAGRVAGAASARTARGWATAAITALGMWMRRRCSFRARRHGMLKAAVPSHAVSFEPNIGAVTSCWLRPRNRRSAGGEPDGRGTRSRSARCPPRPSCRSRPTATCGWIPAAAPSGTVRVRRRGRR